MSASPIQDVDKSLPNLTGSDGMLLLLLVGGMAAVFVCYLVIDYLMVRKRKRRFERRVKEARNAAQR